MKKNYFFVLVALLSFALCSYAQDDTTQDENYNMTVKLPDGTTLTVNTDDVDEVTFSNGTLIVTGTRIDEIVAKLKQIIEEFNSYGVEVQDAKAYIEQLVADFKVLQDVVNMLKMKTEDNMTRTEDAYKYAIESYDMGHMNTEYIRKHEDDINFLKECVQALQTDMAALQAAIAAIPACSCADLTGQLAALEAELADTRALSQYAMNMSQAAMDAAYNAQERADAAYVMAERLYEVGEENKVELKAYTDAEIAAAKAEMMKKAEDAMNEIMPYVYELREICEMMQRRIAVLETTVAAQNAQIATLQEEVEEQKQKNAELEARVSMLEEMLKNVEERLDWQLGVKEQKND